MTTTADSPALTYRDAGVDIDAGASLVERIKPAVARTKRSGQLGSLGGFGGLFEIPAGYQQPVLVSGTDGVGTKLRLAIDSGKHNTVGIDLVAMCVNDILVQGAEPLFFLDYYATAALDVDIATDVISGIAKGCELAGCALIGGETAEMPGMYGTGDYDLAGFSVGVVEKNNLIDGSKISAGDVVLGLASSGPHSNGYSLIRKVLEVTGVNHDAPLNDKPLIEHLITPTRIYVKALLGELQTGQVHGLSHITGGGLSENLPRVIGDDLDFVIDLDSWTLPTVFDWLRSAGNIADDEMLRTFNCGIGMAVIVSASTADALASRLSAAGETVYRIGEIASGTGSVQYRGQL